MITSLLKDLGLAFGRGLVQAIVQLAGGEPEPKPEPAPPVHPKFRDLEHIRSQERSAIAFKVPAKGSGSREQGSGPERSLPFVPKPEARSPKPEAIPDEEKSDGEKPEDE